MYTDQHLERENWVRWSDKGGDGVSSPSCSQSLSHLLCQICPDLLVFLGGKTVSPRVPVSKVEIKTFHRRKERRLWRHSLGSLDIDVLVLLVFWRMDVREGRLTWSPRCFSRGPVNYFTSGWMDGFWKDYFKGYSEYVYSFTMNRIFWIC